MENVKLPDWKVCKKSTAYSIHSRRLRQADPAHLLQRELFRQRPGDRGMAGPLSGSEEDRQ